MATLRIKAVSVLSEAAAITVRRYAEMGLIDAHRDSNGNWVFGPEAVQQVRAVKARRSKSCGRKTAS